MYFSFLGVFIQRGCLYPEIYCRSQKAPSTTRIPNWILKLTKIQLIKNSICQEKKSSIKIQQYDNSYKAWMWFKIDFSSMSYSMIKKKSKKLWKIKLPINFYKIILDSKLLKLLSIEQNSNLVQSFQLIEWRIFSLCDTV